MPRSSGRPLRTDSHASAADWLQGARPRTWPNAIAPVIAGSAAAATTGDFHLGRALLALIVAWSFIIGVNFANDYSDGIRGTDDDRSGPLRLTASGLVSPKKVRLAAFIALGVGALAGLWLSLLSSWWLIIVGALCILGAWFYTGGKNPYGYRGFGEVAVFIFFGLVAVLGTQFTQAGSITFVGLACAVAVGSISASVNLVNNLRDIPTDAATGKITLAVRLGESNTRTLYLILACVPLVVSLLLVINTPLALIGLLAAPLIAIAARPVVGKKKGAELIPVLGWTGRAMLIWALLTAVALFIAA